nr:zinc ribbon domain-containing protein [uncultured Roseibium sp.]
MNAISCPSRPIAWVTDLSNTENSFAKSKVIREQGRSKATPRLNARLAFREIRRDFETAVRNGSFSGKIFYALGALRGAAHSDKIDHICDFTSNTGGQWERTLTWEDYDLFCSQCGNDVNDTDRFCSRCGNALSAAKPPAIDAEQFETDSDDWQDTLDYRLVLHSPEVRKLVEDAAGTTRGGMTAEQFLKGVLPIVNVSGAKLAPVEFMMELDAKVKRRFNWYTERQASRLYDTPPGRVIAAAATALAGRELPIKSGSQGAESCVLETQTSSSAWNWAGEMQLEFSRTQHGTRVEARTKIPGKPMLMRGGETFIEAFLDEISDRLSLQP